MFQVSGRTLFCCIIFGIFVHKILEFGLELMKKATFSSYVPHHYPVLKHPVVTSNEKIYTAQNLLPHKLC